MKEELLFQYVAKSGVLGDCILLDCGREQCIPGKMTAQNFIEKISIHIIMSGKGTLKYDDKEIKLQAGDAFVLIPQMTYSHFPDESNPWAYFWIDVGGGGLEEILKKSGITKTRPYIKNIKKSDAAVYMEKIVLNYEEKGFFGFADMGNFFLLVSEFVGLSEGKTIGLSREESIVKEALRFIGNNTPDVKVEDVASNLGIHPNYFAAIFKKTVGVSPKSYLVSRRMKMAKKLLSDGETSVKRAAELCGYSNQLHFSKEFKKYYGCCPSVIKTYKGE